MALIRHLLRALAFAPPLCPLRAGGGAGGAPGGGGGTFRPPSFPLKATEGEGPARGSAMAVEEVRPARFGDQVPWGDPVRAPGRAASPVRLPPLPPPRLSPPPP